MDIPHRQILGFVFDGSGNYEQVSGLVKRYSESARETGATAVTRLYKEQTGIDVKETDWLFHGSLRGDGFGAIELFTLLGKLHNPKKISQATGRAQWVIAMLQEIGGGNVLIKYGKTS